MRIAWVQGMGRGIRCLWVYWLIVRKFVFDGYEYGLDGYEDGLDGCEGELDGYEGGV